MTTSSTTGAGHSFLNDAETGPKVLRPIERVLNVGPTLLPPPTPGPASRPSSTVTLCGSG